MWSEGGVWAIGIGSRFGHRKVIGKHNTHQEAVKDLKRRGFGGVYKKVSRGRRGWTYFSLEDEKNWRLIYNTRRTRI
jgi:hypothetical protein